MNQMRAFDGLPDGYRQPWDYAQQSWGYPQQPNCGCPPSPPSAQQSRGYPPQPIFDWQRQEPWNTQHPRDARQPGRDEREWNAYGPDRAGQNWLQGGELFPEELESFFEEPIPAVPQPAARQPAVQETARPENPQRSKAIKFILNALTLCVVVFLVVGSTIFAFSNKEDKSLFGYRFYNVLTPSMQPLFRPGDMIFVKLADPSHVKVGDVVTFNPSVKSTAFLTHRVVDLLPADELHPARMVTKGDYNNMEDPPVGLNAVIGTHMFTIPRFGKVVDMMRSNLLLVCVCFGAFFLLLTVLRAYFAARKQERAEPTRPLTLSPHDIHAFQADRHRRPPAACATGLL